MATMPKPPDLPGNVNVPVSIIAPSRFQIVSRRPSPSGLTIVWLTLGGEWREYGPERSYLERRKSAERLFTSLNLLLGPMSHRCLRLTLSIVSDSAKRQRQRA